MICCYNIVTNPYKGL